MPWCPNCRTEYEGGRSVCTDCGASLVDEEPVTVASEDPVVVLHAATANEARIAEATLEAEGIPAFVQLPGTVLPQHGNIVDDDNPELDVLVPAEEAERASAILNEPPLTDEEFDALEAADSAQPASDAGV
jgi:hypothetical protein